MAVNEIKRKCVFSGAPWEEKVGYCRALRAGDMVFVTGTAPVADDGSVHSPGNAYEQTRRCFEIIDQALRELEVHRNQIVRTRMYVTDITQHEDYGKAHLEFVGNHRPCTTMVEVKSLIDPEMLIEIEVDAVSPIP